MTDFLDFELGIRSGSTPGEYPISVIRSPAGEPIGLFRFPFDSDQYSRYLNAIQRALVWGERPDDSDDDIATVRNFGSTLFSALFKDELLAAFRTSKKLAEQQGKGLRLRLQIDSPELAKLPWEFLFDPSIDDYVCLSITSPVVRYLKLDQSAQALKVALPLKILGLIGNSSGLDVEAEKGRIDAAMVVPIEEGLIEFAWIDGHDINALQNALRSGESHIFHFIGHGGFNERENEGQIVIDDGHGGEMLLQATELGRLLAGSGIRFAFLNSCHGATSSKRNIHSSVAATLVRRGIPAAVAMQDEISDDSAILFSQSFYNALASSSPVDEAVTEGRIAISLQESKTTEWGVPVLYMRSRDGVIFDFAENNSESEPIVDVAETEIPTDLGFGKTTWVITIISILTALVAYAWYALGSSG